MSGFLKGLADLFFPPRCIFCGEVIRGGEAACPRCVEGLARMEGDLCPACGKEQRDCVCTAEPFYFERAVAPFAYDGRVRHGVLELKRNKHSPAFDFFGGAMAGCVGRDYGDITFGAVTYVPSAPDSERGFNQAERLASAVAARLGLPCVAPPVDKRPGAPAQHTRSYHGRRQNAQDSYGAGKGMLGGHVLLVDDVMTTGATLSRCAELLKKAGATGVYAVTAAATLKTKQYEK